MCSGITENKENGGKLLEQTNFQTLNQNRVVLKEEIITDDISVNIHYNDTTAVEIDDYVDQQNCSSQNGTQLNSMDNIRKEIIDTTQINLSADIEKDKKRRRKKKKEIRQDSIDTILTEIVNRDLILQPADLNEDMLVDNKEVEDTLIDVNNFDQDIESIHQEEEMLISKIEIEDNPIHSGVDESNVTDQEIPLIVNVSSKHKHQKRKRKKSKRVPSEESVDLKIEVEDTPDVDEDNVTNQEEPDNSNLSQEIGRRRVGKECQY